MTALTAPSVCEACGADSTSPRGRSRRFCSDKCRCWARLHPGETRATGRNCGSCGANIDDKAAHARFCSKRCLERSAGRHVRATLGVRLCGYCGVAFKPLRGDQAACSAQHGNRMWDRDNHARLRSIKARRREAIAATPHEFTKLDLALRMSMFAGCWVCDGPKEQIDHVKPLAKGGLHILANLRPICASCNRKKWAHWPWAP